MSIISSRIRKPDQIIQPWMFGHYETKATCFWLDGLPPLEPLYKTPDECAEALGIARGTPLGDRIHKMAPGPNRARDRSETFLGVAREKARQWGAQHQRISEAA